jgi:nucleotide-binding universal stress UspA family protein
MEDTAMIAFRNIILPTDFSKNAAAAAPFAGELARRFGGSIHLIHVFDTALYLTSTAADAFAVLSATPAGWIESKMNAEKKVLAELATTISEAEKVPVTPVLKRGTPANVIVEFAAEKPEACIVTATHGHSALYHMLIGSVAERIVRLSQCPVFSIRPATSP